MQGGELLKNDLGVASTTAAASRRLPRSPSLRRPHQAGRRAAGRHPGDSSTHPFVFTASESGVEGITWGKVSPKAPSGRTRCPTGTFLRAAAESTWNWMSLRVKRGGREGRIKRKESRGTPWFVIWAEYGCVGE